MKILIVDDEAIVRRSLRRAAEHRGHEAIEAEGGQQGLQLWCQESPDLVFLDVLMPDLSGPEVLSRLGEKKGPAKVILISAYAGDYDSGAAQQMGADLFLPKPFADIFKVIDLAEKMVNRV